MKIFFKNITTKVIVLSLFLFMCVAVNNSYAQEGGITPGSPLGGGAISNPSTSGGLATSYNSSDAAFEKLKKEKAAKEAAEAAAKKKKKEHYFYLLNHYLYYQPLFAQLF